MQTIRRVEAILGICAGALGILALAYLLFGPTYSFSSSNGQSGTASLLQVGISPLTAGVFFILVCSFLVAATSACLHSRTGAWGWRVVLWLTLIPPGVLTILGLASVGLLIFPATVGVFSTALLSLGVKREKDRAWD